MEKKRQNLTLIREKIKKIPIKVKKNKFNVENKAEFVKLASAPAESTRIRTNTQFKVADDHWFTVKDNIFEAKNWSRWIKE